MKRVYLDQWAWIRLTRASLDRPDNPRDVDLLSVARRSVELGLASFPVSAVHYMELASGASPRQRDEMADLIWELSRQHTMVAAGTPVLEAELDGLLQRQFGRPTEARSNQMFGIGLGHAFHRPPLAGRIVSADGSPAPIDPGLRRYLEETLTEFAERYMLAGPREEDSVADYDPRAHLVVNEQFVAEENAWAGKLRGLPKQKHSRAEYARAWAVEILPLLGDTLERANLPWSVIPRDEKGLTDFLRELPTLWAYTELKRLHHQNPGLVWKIQDFSDLNAFTVAVVHCDIVVFDKKWMSLARRARLDQLNVTIVCKFDDLLGHLVTL